MKRKLGRFLLRLGDRISSIGARLVIRSYGQS